MNFLIGKVFILFFCEGYEVVGEFGGWFVGVVWLVCGEVDLCFVVLCECG